MPIRIFDRYGRDLLDQEDRYTIGEIKSLVIDEVVAKFSREFLGFIAVVIICDWCGANNNLIEELSVETPEEAEKLVVLIFSMIEAQLAENQEVFCKKCSKRHSKARCN